VGVEAAAFPSPGQMASWGGICPGRQESAGVSHDSRSAKGNQYLRRVLTQAAQAAVKKNGSHLQAVFRRLLPRVGYQQAVWAIALRLCRLVWKILHDGVRYEERGVITSPRAQKRRVQKMVRSLRLLGYQVQLTPVGCVPVNG
jgi:transposase